MSKRSKRSVIVDVMGGFGYLSCMLQWLWAAALFLPTLLDNKTVKEFILPENKTDQPIQHIAIDGSSLILTAIAIIITFIVLVVTIIVLVRLPTTIAKKGRDTVNTTAQKVIPIITHHQPLTPQKQTQLSVKLRAAIKLVIVIIPALLLGLTFILPGELSPNIALTIGGFLAASSLFWFILEYVIARMLKQQLQTIF